MTCFVVDNVMALRHVFLLAAVVTVTLVTASSRAVNISNTWMLPEEGFPVFYRYFRDRISWYEADAVCQFHHGNLVTVDSTSQYDAIRAYLKELDVTNNVWIGLSRNAEKPSFKWTDFRPLSTVNNYWQEALPTGKEALCAAMDPATDFRWHALPCGGPSVAAFICELPVPSRATGPDGCLPTGLPSLTVVYKPETGALVLTSDCGKNVTKTVYCKGDANRDAIVRLLTCNNSNEDFDDSSTSASNTQQDSSVSASSVTTIHPNAIPTRTTKSWTSNTIGSNEFESPTRHRRETEDTMSPTSTRSTTQAITFQKQESSKPTTSASIIDLVTIVSRSTSELNHIEISTEAHKTSESATTDNASSSTVEDQGDVYVGSTTSADMKSGSDLTNIDGGDYQSAINQGQLFSIIENGGMFDIIELNETSEENKTAKSSEPASTSTDGSNSLYTTVMYHKEPPSEVNVATTDFKETSKETSTKKLGVTTSLPLKDMHKTKTINDLSSQKLDKTLNKEVEIFPVPAGNPYAKLNRTNRKELPMMEYIEQDNESINLDVNNDINAVEGTKPTASPISQKEVVPVISQHHMVEIQIHKNADSKEPVSTLFVTTKHHDTKGVTKKPEVSKKLTTEKPELSTEAVQIDPKIDTLNAVKAQSNATAVKDAEVISLVSSVADRIKEISSEEIMKDQLPIAADEPNRGSNTSVAHEGEAGGDSSDRSGEDESLQKPNRQRQLTRPQRRSFYPYFFSRVLG